MQENPSSPQAGRSGCCSGSSNCCSDSPNCPPGPENGSPPSEPAGPACCCSPKSPWHWLLIAFIVIILIVVLARRSGKENGSGPSVAWNTDYTAAVGMAKQQNKPLLLAFHAIWCGPCNDMKKTTYHDAGVIQASEEYIPVMIDVDEQGEIAEQYSIQGIPAYVLVNPDGTILSHFAGYKPAEEFIERLHIQSPRN